MKLASLQRLLRNLDLDNVDNLHRIAIANLEDGERRLQRWWAEKYCKPMKSYEEHRVEELTVELLEDFYEKHPEEIQKFLEKEVSEEDLEWDGSMPAEYERQIKRRLDKINQKNETKLSKYKSDVTLTEAEEKELLDGLGRDLKKSRMEFDEVF